MIVDVLRAAGTELRSLKATNRSVRPHVSDSVGWSGSRYTNGNLKNENDIENS